MFIFHKICIIKNKWSGSILNGIDLKISILNSDYIAGRLYLIGVKKLNSRNLIPVLLLFVSFDHTYINGQNFTIIFQIILQVQVIILRGYLSLSSKS